jgi:MoxR-like ATPase
MATQNHRAGTFPLPEAQLDRFLLRLRLGYPSEGEEGQILSRFQQENPLVHLASVTEAAELLNLQKICRQVFVDDSIHQYIIALVRATREHSGLKLGASPRAALGLNQAAQALAAMQGRYFVTPDDVKYLAIPTLAHRIIAKPEARLKGHSTEEIIKELLTKIAVPVEDQKRR